MKKSKDKIVSFPILFCLVVIGLTAPLFGSKTLKNSLLGPSYTEGLSSTVTTSSEVETLTYSTLPTDTTEIPTPVQN